MSEEIIQEETTPEITSAESLIKTEPSIALPIESDVPPPRRGRRSIVPTMYALEPGQCFVCPPGVPKRPHQTVYYHNLLAKKNNTGKVWGVSCRVGVYRIHRLK